MKSHLITGDTALIISGEHKGKSGKVVKIDKKANKAMIDGIGVRERHMRATSINPKGGKKTIHLGIDLSNLKKVEEKK